MKKILILFLILFSCLLTSCKAANSIYYNTFIASIGFEKNNDKYTGYFFLPSSIALGNTKQDKSEDASQIAKVDGDNIFDVFNNFFLSSAITMNLKHISTIVLHESILNNADINKIISFIKEYEGADLNFYIFTTNSKLEDIYSVKNPNNESVILTMLCEPLGSNYIYTIAKPVHFLNFCRDYYNEKVIYLPVLSPANIWDDKIDSCYCRGVTFLSIKNVALFDYRYEDFEYISSKNEFEYNDDNISVIYEGYSFKIKYDDIININIKSKVNILYSNINNELEYIKEMIEKKISNLILNFQEKTDFLNLKYNSSLNKSIKINVELKLQ